MNEPKRRLGLSLTCVLIGCVILTIVTHAPHRVSLRGTVSLLSAASQNLSNATPRPVNASSGEALSSASEKSRRLNFSSLPVAFEPNLGQTDPQVKYLARGNGYTLFLTSSEAVLSLAPEPAPASKQKANRLARFARSTMRSRRSHESAVIRMQVTGANPHAQIAGNENLPGISKDRKSTRLNSSHSHISYAVFCLKKKRSRSILPRDPRRSRQTACPPGRSA